mmetsp:Transcript_10395/g.29643  ORF Transcript_10395/g.29643 Transcript_10395/m.29643 type:complete len:285 (+) Transcript_10395:1616-2470(+)
MSVGVGALDSDVRFCCESLARRLVGVGDSSISSSAGLCETPLLGDSVRCFFGIADPKLPGSFRPSCLASQLRAFSISVAVGGLLENWRLDLEWDDMASSWSDFDSLSSVDSDFELSFCWFIHCNASSISSFDGACKSIGDAPPSTDAVDDLVVAGERFELPCSSHFNADSMSSTEGFDDMRCFDFDFFFRVPVEMPFFSSQARELSICAFCASLPFFAKTGAPSALFGPAGFSEPRDVPESTEEFETALWPSSSVFSFSSAATSILSTFNPDLASQSSVFIIMS